MTAQPLDADLARRYVDGSTSITETLQVEQSVMASAEWRGLVGSNIDPGRLELNFAAIEAELDAPRRRLVERTMVRVGLPEHVARLMAATPVLRRAWYLASVLVLFFGLAAASPDRAESSLTLFLALAPLVPVLGVGIAYGPGVDPAYEMTMATPLSSFRLLLLRSVAVLATSVVFGGVASVLLAADEGLRVVAWMLPALALTTITLVLASFVPTRVAAAVTSGLWLVVVSIVANAGDELVLFEGAAQLVYALLAVVVGAVLIARRDAFELLGVGR